MAAQISLFDPGSHTFSVVTGTEAASPQNEGKLLLNILIELRVQTMYLAATSANLISDDPQVLRADVVSNGPQP
jgi:hypothetical protein